ncbi:uracil phosphoribosyltransferase [uncultured Bacteroides sp.]|uniref:uracil phosphoribosyltransferase n=1 Tax=uncultured Bacteroides sp. TaxID=162156 RepID=UPI002622E502|nr:uracil phosphoribosyltransferase [uncultured Bacteroides sp.]
MKIVDFSKQNTILNQYLAEIRDVNIQGDRLRFRRNIERIGEIMAYEISRELPYRPLQIQTPLALATENVPAEQPVIATILRAGLPLHQGFTNFFDHAENAFVSAYRKYIDEDNFDIHIEYIASPRLEGKTLILVDPMLATGGSMELAYKALLTKGEPAHIHIASVIASDQAVAHVQQVFPADKTSVWCATIDPELNAHSYIVPGLGDAGDLCYGEKE